MLPFESLHSSLNPLLPLSLLLLYLFLNPLRPLRPNLLLLLWFLLVPYRYTRVAIEKFHPLHNLPIPLPRSSSILAFPLLSIKVNDPSLLTLSLIVFLVIIFTPSFVNLYCPFLLRIFPGTTKWPFLFHNGRLLWMRRCTHLYMGFGSSSS